MYHNLFFQQAYAFTCAAHSTLLDKGQELPRVRHRRLLIDSLAAIWRHRQTGRDDIHREPDISIRETITATRPT
jgi:hypothetical protein